MVSVATSIYRKVTAKKCHMFGLIDVECILMITYISLWIISCLEYINFVFMLVNETCVIDVAICLIF